ncbi:MAG: uncharacterized protein PWP65_765 [Clostridia bacterium]|nr:uncharacterized protein [Clostridia bacterium]
MPRPRKCRRIAFTPALDFFKPVGRPLRELEEVNLALEELEAIRLKDLEGLEQEECAERMQISRPTFQRILVAARNKIAEALVEGKAIRIGGGDYVLANSGTCPVCGQEWEGQAGDYCPRCRRHRWGPRGMGWRGRHNGEPRREMPNENEDGGM